MGNGNLTERQQVFVSGLVNGFCQTEAARHAGYAAPTVAAVRLVRRAGIKEAVFAKRQALLQGDFAGTAMENLRWLLEDPGLREKNPDLVFRSSRYVLELAGHRAEESKVAGEDKPLAEKTLAEIQDSIRRTKELRDSLDAVLDTMKRASPVEAEQSA